jgi:hypothetical protein
MFMNECKRCKGKGWILVPNGPDDYEHDFCPVCNDGIDNHVEKAITEFNEDMRDLAE